MFHQRCLAIENGERRKSKHNDKSENEFEDNLELAFEQDTTDGTATIASHVDHGVPTLSELRSLGFHSDSNTPEFLSYELQEKGMGIRYLTGRAFQVNPSSVSDEEARFCLQLSSLLVQLTDHQRDLLAKVLITAGNNGNERLSIFHNIRLPTTAGDFERLFLTGRNALIPNLPHPVAQSVDSGSHAYVSLTDLLANELAKATRYDDFEFLAKLHVLPSNSVPSISSTECAKRLLIKMKEISGVSPNGELTEDEFVIFLWLREWRDDFDPNNTKSSRNQAWCNTYTISPPSDTTTKGTHTYFMSLSAKGDDHRVVEEILTAELEKVQTKGLRLYHAGLRRVVKVF